MCGGRAHRLGAALGAGTRPHGPRRLRTDDALLYRRERRRFRTRLRRRCYGRPSGSEALHAPAARQCVFYAVVALGIMWMIRLRTAVSRLVQCKR